MALSSGTKTCAKGCFGTNTYESYTGNRLNSIRGFTTSSYSYDANGNLKTDSQKGITNIGYNYLNLPQTITAPVTLAYSYDATGRKLSKLATGSTSSTTDYVDGIQYTNGVIDFIQTEESIAFNSGGSYSYRYNLGDHLGNVRATFRVNGSNIEVLQRDDYYAFGLKKSVNNDIGAVSLENKYLYNGKELQEELGQYDYGARFYDPVIGRWNVVDPEQEKYERWSPYNYVLNNPIRNIDPRGDTVRIDPSASKQFLADYKKVREFLSIMGLDEQIKRLESSTSVYMISETYETNGRFIPNRDSEGQILPGGSIAWNPTFALETTNGTVMSPTTILNHEFDHAASYDQNPKAHVERTRSKDEKYGNMEEKRVIMGSEQKTARRLGEVDWWKTTRSDHSAKRLLFAPDPTKNAGTPTITSMNLKGVEIKTPSVKKVNPNKKR